MQGDGRPGSSPLTSQQPPGDVGGLPAASAAWQQPAAPHTHQQGVPHSSTAPHPWRHQQGKGPQQQQQQRGRWSSVQGASSSSAAAQSTTPADASGRPLHGATNNTGAGTTAGPSRAKPAGVPGANGTLASHARRPSQQPQQQPWAARAQPAGGTLGRAAAAVPAATGRAPAAARPPEDPPAAAAPALRPAMGSLRESPFPTTPYATYLQICATMLY